MTLRGALGFSAAFHVLIFTVAPFAGWLPKRSHKFEVSYLPPRLELPAPAAPEKPRLSIPAVPAPAPQEIRRAVPLPPIAPIIPMPRPVSEPVPKAALPPIPILRPTISSVPEKGFVFLDHKERIRKHLKARLNYPPFLSDGTVRLRLVLGPEGAFKQAVVVEASDPRLAAVAVKDAQAASPYPRLPGKIHPRQLRYEFLVRYRPE